MLVDCQNFFSIEDAVKAWQILQTLTAQERSLVVCMGEMSAFLVDGEILFM